MLSIAKWGGMFRVWNEVEALQIEVGEGIEERSLGLRCAYSYVETPLGVAGGEEECSESGME